MPIEQSAEAEAFLGAVQDTAPGAVSACEGWTTHEVAAHVAGIAVEVVRHLDPFLAGDPVPDTRSFEEREAPLREIPHDALLGLMDEQEARMRAVVADVLDRDPDAVVPWTGRRMAVARFVPHLRNEHALHRWDLVGDEGDVDPAHALLGEHVLVDHSVGELGRILLRAGRDHDPEPDHGFDVRLRSAGEPDLRVVVADGEAGLEWSTTDPADGDRCVELDAAARHLLIWGRRPDLRGRVRSRLAADDLARLQALLSGY